MMRNPLGYKVLYTYKQAEQIQSLVKPFASLYLDSFKDRRLIEHIIDCCRSVKQNIAEGYARVSSQEYLQFLGFSLGSLVELLEDLLDLQKDIRVGLREIKGSKGTKEETLNQLDKLIKLVLGEKTMLQRQMERLEKRLILQGDTREQIKKQRDQMIKKQLLENFRARFY